MTEIGRLTFRFALAVAFAAALGLTACGRKSIDLDPPPSTTAAQPDAAGTSPAEAGDSDSQEPAGTRSRAPAKRIPLDVLLN